MVNGTIQLDQIENLFLLKPYGKKEGYFATVRSREENP